MELWQPEYSNCLIWAYVMRRRYGGYVIARKSRHGWWNHYLYSKDLKLFYSYAPPERLQFTKLGIPPPIFKGLVYVNAD